MTTRTPKTVAELRAEIAKGIATAAAVYRANADLGPLAISLADRLETRADQIKRR